MDILLYGTSLVLEFVALVRVADARTDAPRPFRIPGGVLATAALGLGPLGLLGFALVKNADEQVGGVNALAFGLGVMLLGPLTYAATRIRAAR